MKIRSLSEGVSTRNKSTLATLLACCAFLITTIFAASAGAQTPNARIASREATVATLRPQMKVVATDVTVVTLAGTGHRVMEERPKETMKALVKFL